MKNVAQQDASALGMLHETGRIDGQRIRDDMNERGWSILPAQLDGAQCTMLKSYYRDDARFRSTIDMKRYGFGSGQYRYFKYPLPETVQSLRETLYGELVSLANDWSRNLKLKDTFPASHAEFIAQCHSMEQLRPTPLLLRYTAGDYNCLHQDVYGARTFPFQVIFMLSTPGDDYEGGELVLMEQRPRRQSRVGVVPLRAGDGVVIATNHIPRLGSRGYYRATLKHGVSEITRGERYTLGIVFHDAT